MSEEEFKSPWQIEHEKKLVREVAAKKAIEKTERAEFLRRFKLTRKSDKSLLRLSEKQANASSEYADETSSADESENSSESKKYVRNQKTKEKSLSIFTSAWPVLKRLWFPLIIFLIVFAGSIYALSPLNHVGNFTVVGNTMVTSGDVAKASEIRMNDTIVDLFINRATVESRVVKSSPRIESATMQIAFPNKLSFHIHEYQSIGYVQQKEKNYIFLSNGLIIRDSVIAKNKLNTSLPFLKNFSNNQTRNFASAYKTLKPSLKSLIRMVTITPTQSTKDFITLQMADGNQVKVPLSQMKEKLPYYPSVANNLQSPETVDMEVGIFAAPTPNYNSTFKDNVPKKNSKSPSHSSLSDSSESSSAQ